LSSGVYLWPKILVAVAGRAGFFVVEFRSPFMILILNYGAPVGRDAA